MEQWGGGGGRGRCNRAELLASCSAFGSLEARSNSFIKLNESSPNIILRLVS